MILLLIGFIAGVIAGVSPCVVPVLPVIFVAGATTQGRSSWRRALSIVAGLVISFSILILAGAEIISTFHLPQTFLRDLGVGLLIVVGLGLLTPELGRLIERPFERVVTRQPLSSSGGFVIGLALGLVFVPCAGPVLSTIIVLGAREDVNLMTILVTVTFSLGAAVPLLFVALAGGALVERARWLRRHAPTIRRIGGAVLIVMAVAILTDLFNSLQTDVPGYTSALQRHVEGSTHVRHELDTLKGTTSTDGSLAACSPSDPVLQRCGEAPNFADVTAWLNTPDDRPLTIEGLRHKVVLVDFWTYSCINCERALPHVEAWYRRYGADGLVVVGVHTPEFAFEHVVSNVKSAAGALGVTYPIDVDDHYATWDAYDNEYWPADYLVDAKGVVRHVTFGEGDYGQTETLIRKLLVEAHPGLKLPPRTDVPDLTPAEPTNPETYVGYQRLQYIDNAENPPPDVATTFHFPTSLTTGYFALAGVWNDHEQEATAGRDAALELSYRAKDVFLVMGGTGTVTVSTGPGRARTISVSGVPRLYRLWHSSSVASGTLTLRFTPGVEAYDFTFG